MYNRKKSPGRVISNVEISPGIYDMRIGYEFAEYAVPGQFVMIYPKAHSTLLPRPISICDVIFPESGEKGLRLVYRVAGKGTAEFSGYAPGDEIWVLGPLGNGYFTAQGDNEIGETAPLPSGQGEVKPCISPSLLAGKTVLLLGGGIGIPPLLYLAKAISGLGNSGAERAAKAVYAGLGYRNADLFLQEDFMPCATVLTATEDGSVGTKGTVLDAVRERGITPDIICACGPMPMLRAIKSYAGELGIPACISLEERMACGVGACLGCVCNTVDTDHHSHVKNARVCTEGPVFLASTVDI